MEDYNNKNNNKKEKRSSKNQKELLNDKLLKAIKLLETNKKPNYNISSKFDNKLLDNYKISKKDKIPNINMTIKNKSSNTKNFIPNNKMPNKIKLKLINNNINDLSKNKNQISININKSSHFNIQKIILLNQENFPAYDPSFTYSNSLINLKKSEEEIYNNFYNSKIVPEILK